MSVDEIIAQILSVTATASREDIWKKIREKKHAAGGFLTDETAARLVASELGIEVAQENARSAEFPIGELIFGLNDVSVLGRVLVVYAPRSYARRNGAESQFASLVVADKSGALRVLFWDDKAYLLSDGKVRRGQIVRVLHGYVREARDGQLELHLGQRGDLHVNPSDVKGEDFPEAESFVEKIGKLTKKVKRASVLGSVERVSELRAFARSDGSEGKVLRLTLRDSSGRMTTVFWNDNAAALNDAQVGERLLVVDARVKEKIDGQLELHVDNGTYFERLPPALGEFSKISGLVSEGGPVSVEAVVQTKPVRREISTAKGETVSLTSFEVKDESGGIWVSAWRENAAIAEQLTVGAKVRLFDVYVRKGFGNALELATRASSRIAVLKE